MIDFIGRQNFTFPSIDKLKILPPENIRNQKKKVHGGVLHDVPEDAKQFGAVGMARPTQNKPTNSSIPKNVNQFVSHQAKLAKKANLDAIVCSAHEVKIVKKFFKKEIITPGIRFNTKSDDQKRVVTPKQAYKNGSDWLVIGRPITNGNIRKNIQTLIDHLSQ